MPRPSLHPVLWVVAAVVVAACAVGAAVSRAPQDAPAGGPGAAASAPAAAPGPRAENVVQGAAPGQPGRTLAPGETPSVTAAAATPADVTFARRMLHHHAQALTLADMVAGRSDDRRLALFVERMRISQTAEIETMERWLSTRGHPVPARPEGGGDGHGEGHGDGHGDGHGEGHEDGQAAAGTGDELRGMPGMLSDEELARVAAARGPAFERLWLEGMVRHHEGAITMVRELVAAGGGQEPEMFTLASHVESDQQVEIDRMRAMLAGL